MTSPEGAPVVAIIVGYIGPVGGRRTTGRARPEFWLPHGGYMIGPMSYVQLNTLLDAGVPYGGVQRYWKSSFLKHLGDDVLDILVARAATISSPMSMVGFFHVHGAATQGEAAPRPPLGSAMTSGIMTLSSQWLKPEEFCSSYPVDPRVLDGSGALRHGRSVCQPPRRGGRHTDQSRL